MMDVSIVLTACIILALFANPGQSCGPAEIGQQYTITSSVSETNATAAWQLLVNEKVSVIDNHYEQLYNFTKTELTITNVTKKDGTGLFQLVINCQSFVYNCTLPVYKRASTPTCEPVTVTENQIRTNCTTDQVYPQAKCQFTLQNAERDKRNNITAGSSYITYTHTDPQASGNEYYSTSCTLHYPVNGLKPGNWTVQVTMYPNQTGVSLAQGTVGNASKNIQLSVPSVKIENKTCPTGLDGKSDKNVRDGYVRQGKQASCLCTRDHAGNPPGNITWISTEGANFVNLSKNGTAASIHINSTNNFTCKSISVLNGSHSMTYTPKYAYGPGNASLNFKPSGPINLCSDRQVNIDITCQVPVNSFNPGLLFTIADSHNNSLVTQGVGDHAQNKSVNYNITKPGPHTFTCRVENKVFIDMFSEAPVNPIHVYAPPNSPPSINVTGQFVVSDNSETWVKQGSNISVNCTWGVAYPPVSKDNVNVSCGSNSSLSDQLFVSGVSGDELKCQCSVDHETKGPCNDLNLTEDITIQTAYGPNNVTMRLGNDKESLNLCSSEVILTVICAVKQSDVQPRLTKECFTLTTPKTDKIQQQYLNTSEGEYKSVNKLKFTSGGSHILVCEARNPKFSDIKKNYSMTLEVRAPPNSPPSINVTGQFVVSDNSETWVKQGSNISVNCTWGVAYPPVSKDNVNVSCGSNSSLSDQLFVSGVSGDELKCQCSVDHETKGPCNDLNLTEDITIQTAYGPNNVTMRLWNDKESLNLCSSEVNVTVICAVKQSDVRPELTEEYFALTTPNTDNIQQQSLNKSEGEYKLVNKLKFTSGGSHILVCEATNPKFSDIKKNYSMTLEVREPPRELPKISALSSQYGDVFVEGDDVTVICDVSGGYPSVQSVTLTCGQDQPVTSNGKSATLTLNEIGLEYNDTNCTCQATHVTGCYDLKGVLPLVVILANSTQFQFGQEDSPPISLAVGGAFGSVVLVAVVVGLIFFIWRERKKKESQSSETKGYDPYKDPHAGYDPHQDPTAVFRDNSELYGSSPKGYDPHQDPTAVFRDNSELYGSAAPKAYDPHQDPTAVFRDNSELYGSAAPKAYDPHQDPTAVFRDNSDLYASAATTGYDPHKDPTAVFIDNSELYGSAASQGYDPHKDPTAVFRDNSELYGSAAAKGYDPHKDPTAVFIDNSELYGSAASKGYDPHKDPTAVFTDNSELYGSVASKGYDPHKDPTAVFRDNSELYGSAAPKGYDPYQDPTAVFRDNSELYGSVASKGYDPHKDPTAVFVDNSELYASASKAYDPHQDPTAVFRDNSELYGSASKVRRVSTNAKNYKNLQPTITSGTAVPKVYRPDTEIEDNPYEEVNVDELKMKQEMFAKKSKTRPVPAAKPKPTLAPKPTLIVQPNRPHDESVRDVYTNVTKEKLQASTKSKSEQSNDITMKAPAEPPEVPAKLYTEEDLKESVDEPKDNEKKKKSKYNPLKKKKKKGKDKDQSTSPKTKAEASPKQDTGPIYFNEAFDESDTQPYANMSSV